MEVGNLKSASRQENQALTRCAFVVTDPTDESNSSRVAVIWKQFGG